MIVQPLTHKCYPQEYVSSYNITERLDVLAPCTTEYIPVFAFRESIFVEGNAFYTIKFPDITSNASGHQMYWDEDATIEILLGGSLFTRMINTNDKVIIINRGAIIDITDKDNPIILMCVFVKQSAIYKYASNFATEYRDFSSNDFDAEDLIIKFNHSFIDKDACEDYVGFYKLLKDQYIDSIYNDGIEIRHVKSIDLFVERKFPTFDTIEDRKKFYSILHKFIDGPQKIFKWQAETEVLDTNGKETLSIKSPKVSTLLNSVEAMKKYQKLVQRANSLGRSTI